MRRYLSACAALTVAGALAGASLAAPASAATTTAASAQHTATTTQAAAKPQSPLYTRIVWNKAVRRGGTITYSVKSTNQGEWATDVAGLFAKLPRGASKIRVVSRSKAFCEVSGRDLFCLYDTLNSGRSASLKVKVWLKRSTRGTAVAEFGHFSIDVPAGVDITNEEELNKLDIQNQINWKTFKTRIVR
ncbi:hypothetical protein Skr01_31930 [Sphaerisporangium krabiense]|uniref:hypothetical protein n=1 Tax=Sphaerisporangium krabiense TaxID=763782 RepID=UPI001610B1C8|nr:hypothetical protein [Sphaerisporangium krabiense]GII63108.1 hypothetical protein Skr01_31930 [Sphaerisporangium krabiense]